MNSNNLIIENNCVVGFYDFSIAEVDVPEGVTKIADGAFRKYYGLEKMMLPRSLIEIGEYAFYKCTSLKAIWLKENLESIGQFAFAHCYNLETIVFNNSKIKIDTLKRGTFSDCYRLKTFQCPRNLIKIEPSVFSDCKELTLIDFNSKLMAIEDSFHGCLNLKELWLPKSVIHMDIMRYSNIETVHLTEEQFAKFQHLLPSKAQIEYKQKFENLDRQFLLDNMYSIKIDVLGGVFGQLYAACELEFNFDNDEFGEELNLKLDYMGCDGSNYCSWDPVSTYVRHGNGYTNESYNCRNDFLYELKKDIINLIDPPEWQKFEWLKDDDFPFGEYPVDALPEILYDKKYDCRKHIDSEFVYVLSIGVHNSIEPTKRYKKLINSECRQFGFLQDLFDVEGPFFNVIVNNDLMKLKDYMRFFLANNLKRGGMDCLDEDQRYLYDADGNGVRCPICNTLLIYSTSLQKHMCPEWECGKKYTKNYLEEMANSTISCEELPKIFK